MSQPTSGTVEPILCMIKDNCKAYFTSIPLSKTTGDDWNDSPHFCNAGPPYTHDTDGNPIEITVLYFDCDLSMCDKGSVDEINAGKYSWLSSWNDDDDIWAGAPISEFKRLIRSMGGSIYTLETAV